MHGDELVQHADDSTTRPRHTDRDVQAFSIALDPIPWTV
jgi:hypothetical protein